MNASPAVRHYTWAEIDGLVQTVAELIRGDDWIPDAITGVLRGGAIPAVQLCHQLDIRDLYTVTAASTMSEGARPVRMATVVRDTPVFKSEARVLLVDDVVNTGQTLQTTIEEIRRLNPQVEIRTACLLFDTVGPDQTTFDSTICTYVGASVHAWVGFPWEG